jgi:hypothetical protein
VRKVIQGAAANAGNRIVHQQPDFIEALINYPFQCCNAVRFGHIEGYRKYVADAVSSDIDDFLTGGFLPGFVAIVLSDFHTLRGNAFY